MKYNVVLSQRNMLEGVRWFGDRIWVSDIFGLEVLSLAADGTDVRVEAHVPGLPLGLGRLPDGEILIQSVVDERILRLGRDGRTTLYADLAGSIRGLMNDMTVDPQGRCWIGFTGFNLGAGEAVTGGGILVIHPDGTSDVVATDVMYPNGIICDGKTLVVSESLGDCLTEFSVEYDGRLTNRRKRAEFGPGVDSNDVGTILASVAVVPDGISEPDAEGAIWVADAVHHRLLRVSASGSILDQLDMGDAQAFAPALGGLDGRTLYITSAPSFAAEERASTKESSLLRTEVAVSLPRAGAQAGLAASRAR